MDNKQTAVEWLVEQMFGQHTTEWQKEIDQALEMEKAQIQSIIDETLSSYRLYLNDSNRIK